jgi:hypothetical protein
MKRILVLLAIATAAIATSVAQAETITNEWPSIGYAGFAPCANGGAGEILSGRIDVHNLVTSTENANNVSYQFQFQPVGSMVGQVTGDTYRVAAVTRGNNENFDTDHSTLTFVNVFHLIGPSSNNNLLVREIAHVTIDGTDDVIVSHDDFSIDCQ